MGRIVLILTLSTQLLWAESQSHNDWEQNFMFELNRHHVLSDKPPLFNLEASPLERPTYSWYNDWKIWTGVGVILLGGFLLLHPREETQPANSPQPFL